MIAALSLVVAALAAQSPGADSLRVLAMRLPESALVVEVRARPLPARDALTEALALSVKGSDDALTAARRLANAYAAAWADSFLVREVDHFARSSAGRRAGKVWVDSVRRAGIAAYGRDGPRTAIKIWRRALSRAVAIRDSAGIGAVLGNIGAGLWREGRLDSAEVYLERARRVASAIGDIRVEANALGALANVSADRGDLAVARERHTRALALRERIGDTRGVAADQNNLGLLAQDLGDLAEARRRFEAALALNRRDGRDEVAATNLVNLAGLASLTGDFADAEGLYRDALSAWREREMWAETADALRGLAQIEMRRGNYPAARSALREALTILDRTGPEADAIATQGELAAALAAAGEMQGALDELRRAQRRADSTRAPPDVRAGIALARADLAVQLNSFVQADQLYLRAEQLYRLVNDAVGEAEAQQGRGALFLEREDYARAQTLLEAALRTQLAAGNRRSAALTRLSLGDVARRRGDTVQARRQLSRAAADLQRLGDPVAFAAALGERARLEASLGLLVAAESLYRAGLRRLTGLAAPEVSWRLHAGLALSRRAQGFADEATRELRGALIEIERPSRSLALPERRSAFLADKWDVYAQLALTERARGRIGLAFEASERLRAREMLELLARGRLHAPRGTADTLIAREQDLRNRIAELTRDLERAAPRSDDLRGPDVSSGSEATREALLRAQESYTELRAELAERAPRHAALVSPKSATWRDVGQRLASSEALIEYMVSDSGCVAFVVLRDTVTAIDLGTTRRELVRLIEFARGTLQQRGTPRTDSLWRAPLRNLHRYLIAPIERSGLVKGMTRFVIVPHAELHYLPFAALVDDEGRSLMERYEIAVTPSGSVWVALGERKHSSVPTGVLALAPRPDALPASRREVAAIEKASNGRVIVGRNATEDVFRREAASYRVLHLATYGVLNKHNPLFSYVELSPGGEHDGRLEVHEVFGLHLTADLVVLSACQTGVGSGALSDVPAGDDWVGLTRAFLHAGAKRVVATLWPIDDWATAAFMDRFYESLEAGERPERALANAQRTMRTTRATAHPFFWAGFVVVGGSDTESARRFGEAR
ncbi:MAG TPA: CHAT domain-containing protein [Gemmatimonadaceae bacterium]|nr:CHAT domain-containing protein [Gemmatimonadaceae bacterium]